MSKSRIRIQAPQKHVFVPPQTSTFEVTVTNNGQKHLASFQLELRAAGVNPSHEWYRVSPIVSSKIPPSDRTKFQVEISRVPKPGFFGLMDVQILVSSTDMADKAREKLDLTIEFQEGNLPIPVRISLPVQTFVARPGETLQIPVQVYTSFQGTIDLTLRLKSEVGWLNGTILNLKVFGGEQIERIFTCTLPQAIDSNPQIQPPISQDYAFTIEVIHSHGQALQRVENSLDQGIVRVLPVGFVQFSCDNPKQRVPSAGSTPIFAQTTIATFGFQIQNKSNLPQKLNFSITGDDRRQLTLDTRWDVPEPLWLGFLIDGVNLKPGEPRSLYLFAKAQRPLVGLAQQQLIEMTATIAALPDAPDRRVDLQTDRQILQLSVLPILPLWMQAIGGLILLSLVFWLLVKNTTLLVLLVLAGMLVILLRDSYLRLFRHAAPIQVVRFNGIVDRLMSGSADRTVRSWRIFFNRLFPTGGSANVGQPVSTLSYRPVENDRVAIGLDQGEIQLWNALLKGYRDPLQSLMQRGVGRVLALEFARDSRSLFCSYSSGWVLQWSVDEIVEEYDKFNLIEPQQKPIRQRKFDFAVYTIQLVGRSSQNLVVAGQNNQLVIWDLLERIYLDHRNGIAKDPITKIAYPSNNDQTEFILGSDVAEFNPYLLVTTDSQGWIRLWNLKDYLDEPEKNRDRQLLLDKLQPIEQWQDGHNKQPIRAIRLSGDGRYLVSGGDDGKVLLWFLTSEGKRDKVLEQGKLVGESRRSEKINSVDIKVMRKNVLIAIASDDTKILLKRIKKLPD
jgi:WD40 repeat protein